MERQTKVWMIRGRNRMRKGINGRGWYLTIVGDKLFWFNNGQAPAISDDVFQPYFRPGDVYQTKKQALAVVREHGLRKKVIVVKRMSVVHGPYPIPYIGQVRDEYKAGNRKYVVKGSGSGLFNCTDYYTIVGKPYLKE